MFNTVFLGFLLNHCGSILKLLIWNEVISHFWVYLLIFLEISIAHVNTRIIILSYFGLNISVKLFIKFYVFAHLSLNTSSNSSVLFERKNSNIWSSNQKLNTFHCALVRETGNFLSLCDRFFFLNAQLDIFTYFNEAQKCFWVWIQDCITTQDCIVQIVKQTLQISGLWKWTAATNEAQVTYCRFHLTSF
jgi:hypothetical protein